MLLIRDKYREFIGLINMSKPITYKTNKSDRIILEYNSLLYKELSKCPFLVIDSNKPIKEFIDGLIIDKVIEDVTSQIMDVVEFYNEDREFYSPKDIELIKSEIEITLNKFYMNIYKGLHLYM